MDTNKRTPYETPETRVLEVKAEGVICQSGGDNDLILPPGYGDEFDIFHLFF